MQNIFIWKITKSWKFIKVTNTNTTHKIFTSYIMTTRFMLLSDFTLCNQCCACVVDDVVSSVHADYVEKLTWAMASSDLQDLIHTVLCYRYLPAKQPSPRIWLKLPSLSPSLPVPVCPSTLGPPWEDASPNPNQVTKRFDCILSLSQRG